MSKTIIIMCGLYFIILGVVAMLSRHSKHYDVTEDEKRKIKRVNIITGICFIFVGSSFIIL
ncbi:hypothetical protein P9X10_02980 [Bacillus cereus]|nr:hypothetical protein [Bacillus cereus]